MSFCYLGTFECNSSQDTAQIPRKVEEAIYGIYCTNIDNSAKF